MLCFSGYDVTISATKAVYCFCMGRLLLLIIKNGEIFMKKLLLAAATTALVSAGSASAYDGSMYLHGKVGYNAPAKENGMKSAFLGAGVKTKTKKAAAFDVGVGYHVMDNMRIEANFHMPTAPKTTLKPGAFELKGLAAGHDLVDYNDQKMQNGSINTKSDVKAIMLKGFVDMPVAEGFTVYAGAGVGMARVSSKSSGSFELKGAADDAVATKFTLANAKAKNKNNFAFSGTVGGAMEVSEGVNVYADYTYNYYGKAKTVKPELTWTNAANEAKKHEIGKASAKKLHGHTVSLGLRINI